MQSSSTKPGFSLVEIVIAVTIMAIVMALVVPGIMNQMQKAKIKATKVALKTVQNAVAQFYGDTGAYPSSLTDLIERPAEEKIARRWESPYLEGQPNDGWGHELVYIQNPKGSRPPYMLYSWGPNGEGSPQDEWIYAE